MANTQPVKRAVILHGTDGHPSMHWFPWFKKQLEIKGYEVWVPELPNNHTPNLKVYNDFLLNSDWNFTDNLIIGHSSGAVSILNLLEDNRCPKIKGGALVGSWAHMGETDLDLEQFKDLFPQTGFDFAKIKQKADKLLFIHSDNDPYCPLDQAEWLAKQTGSEIVIIPGAQHFSSELDAAYKEFPRLIELLEERNLL